MLTRTSLVGFHLCFTRRFGAGVWFGGFSWQEKCGLRTSILGLAQYRPWHPFLSQLRLSKAIMLPFAPEDAEAETLEDVGFFFRFLGGVQLASHEEPFEAPGDARLLACSSKYGLTFFGDGAGALGAAFV